MKKLIMVVDDDPAVVTLVKKMFMREGYLVLGKLSSKAVLNVIDAIKVDLFIIDFMMPDVNGSQLCEKLRAGTVSNDVPIVMFSANDKEGIRQKSLSCGANTFLSKREMAGKLISTVNELLGTQSAPCMC